MADPLTVKAVDVLWVKGRVISSLTKYNIPSDESGSTDALRDTLAAFYAQPTLTKSLITLADLAEMAYSI